MTGPGDDFYRYANAVEIEAMVIPPDRWDFGQTDIAGARVETGFDLSIDFPAH